MHVRRTMNDDHESQIHDIITYALIYNLFYGVLAQLGARNIRIVEATGSNPVYSIFSLTFKLHITHYLKETC